jgi:hypothetical protein
MKTPMQELIENLTNQLNRVVREHPIEVYEPTYWRGIREALETTTEIAEAQALLEKEMVVMCEFVVDYINDCCYADVSGSVGCEVSAEEYFEKTFNTEEK